MTTLSPSIIEVFLKQHDDACHLLREHPEEAARRVHSVIKIVDEDLAREVFRASPKYCAGLPGEYIDSTMAFVPALHFLECGLLRLPTPSSNTCEFTPLPG